MNEHGRKHRRTSFEMTKILSFFFRALSVKIDQYPALFYKVIVYGKQITQNCKIKMEYCGHGLIIYNQNKSRAEKKGTVKCKFLKSCEQHAQETPTYPLLYYTDQQVTRMMSTLNLLLPKLQTTFTKKGKYTECLLKES